MDSCRASASSSWIGLESLRHERVKQRVGREGHRHALVVGVDLHPPLVRLPGQEGASLRVGLDPAGQGQGGVGKISQDERVVSRRAAWPVDPGVES